MDSKSEYGSLEALFGLRPSSQDPLADMFGADSHADTSNPYGSGDSLQLAPLYSNPRHQQERASSLNRYPGWPDGQSYDEYYEDGHEENHESHVSYDASGMHFGVNMSRTHQTPFGPARTDVGMQMSIGHGGMMFSTRSSSSIGGGHGGLLMMSRFGRSPDYSGLGQSMFGPLGIFPPLAGLLSPLGGMFSPMIGCSNPYHRHPLFGLRRPYRTTPQNQDRSTGSDGPIIEEIFDDEEKGYSGSKGETAFMSPLAVEYNEEETDASLGLGLLPDAESECRNDSQNVQELITSSSNEILNDFAYTESSQTSHSESDNEGDDSRKSGTDIYQTGTGAVSRLDIENCQEDRNGLADEAEINRNRLSEITDNTVPMKNVLEDFQDFQESSKLHQIDKKTEINSVTKDRPKFTKQTFRNTVSKSDDVYDNLSFLKPRSPSDGNRTLESQLDADKACDQPMKVNKNEQMTKSKKGMVNKNSSIRRRNDSSSSSSSQQSQTTDIKLSENINFVPKSKIYQVEQNEANSAMQQSETTIVRTEFPQKPDENSTYSSEKNRLALEDNCLSEDTVDRYASLHGTNKNSNSVNEDISKKEDNCKDVWPESLQESSNFTGDIENSTAAKTSTHTVCITNELKTCSENVHGNDSTREEIDCDTAVTGEIHKPASVPHRKFGGGLMEKLSSAEQKGFHEQTMVGIAEVESSQTNTEVQNIEQGDIMTESENDTGSSFENKSKNEVTLRGHRLQYFPTSESDMNSYIQEPSNEDNVERKIYESSLSAKESDMSRTKDDDQISILCNTTPNEDTKQPNHEIQTAPEVKTEERAAQQAKEKHITQRANEQIRKPENQKLETTSHTSETLRDQTFSFESTEDQMHLKDEVEGFRTSPVLENSQFVKTGGYEMSEASRKEMQVLQDASLSPDGMFETTVPIPVVHQESNKSGQSSQRQQTMDVSCTSGYQQVRKGIQRQAQCNHHSYNQETFVNGGHSNHREGIHHSRGCRGQHMCEHLRLQLQCEHRNVQFCCPAHKYVCLDCRKLMSSDEYAEIKTDNDDIFQHPEWEVINEYRDVNGQFTEPRKRPKKTVNKNAAVRTHAAAASASPGQSGTSGVKETRPSSVSFRDLVESVGLVMKDVYPDGNCLFTAVCDQLRIRGDFSYTPRDLRHAAVDYLRDHPYQEDGTPLQEFLTDEERNWERYLSSMRREGHWGDHFVIWALVHVLNRRFIIYRGDSELHKTVVEPSGPLTEESFQESVNSTGVATDGSDTKPTDTELDGKPLLKSVEKDEVYLGHVSQSHYVSLRPHDWHDKLFEALKNKQTSCLVGSNPESNTIDSNGDISVPREVFSFSSSDYLNYFLNYLRRVGFLIKFEMAEKPLSWEDKFATDQYVPDKLFRYKLLPNIMKERTAGLNYYYLSTPRDTTIVEDRRAGKRKDLVLHKENFKVGQFKLIPVTPFIWKSNLSLINGLSFLKHIEFKGSTDMYVIGFKYASWPEEAVEWKTRKRLHAWPSQNTIDEITETGVRVIPAKHMSFDYRDGTDTHAHEEDDLIWEYSFDLSEKILCQRDLEKEAEMMHCILVAVTNLAFEGKRSITEEHIKVLTFFTCETFSSDEIRHHPRKCLYYALEQLKEYLERRRFPHYFMRGRNLIAHMEYDEILWHVERLQVLKTNLVAILYSILDYCTLQNVYDIGKVFDGLSEVTYSRKTGRNILDTYPVTLSVTALTNTAKLKYFKGMERTIDLWYNELVNTYGQKKIMYKEQFVHDVLKELPLQEGWLFALYLDCTLGSEFVKFVCKDKATFLLENLFGHEVAVILSEETFLPSEELALPASLLGEQTVHLAGRLGSVIRYDIGCQNAYQTAVHCFLKTNTHDILLSVEKDQRDKKDYYSHEKLSHLRHLFNSLYDSYQKERAEVMFRDLMEVYDELCNFLATENDFSFLARLWAYYGENVSAREAQMKAASVRDEAYMTSTPL